MGVACFVLTIASIVLVVQFQRVCGASPRAYANNFRSGYKKATIHAQDRYREYKQHQSNLYGYRQEKDEHHEAATGTTRSCSFNYLNQEAWLTFPGSSCGGGRQSPINIKTGKLGQDQNLEDLVFINYDDRVDGILENTCTNVEFVPDEKNAKLKNVFGTYILQQFHFHWGKDCSEGSEHRVDGNQLSAEIHFVHLKKGASPSDECTDTFSVVAVLAKGKDIPIKGIWQKLSPVPTDFMNENKVFNIRYTDLLPCNRDYYQYAGSLTTPLCNETVQWFVLQHPIDIPNAYLAMLRQVERDEFGNLLTFNFRDEQDLNDRQILEFE